MFLLYYYWNVCVKLNTLLVFNALTKVTVLGGRTIAIGRQIYMLLFLLPSLFNSVFHPSSQCLGNDLVFMWNKTLGGHSPSLLQFQSCKRLILRISALRQHKVAPRAFALCSLEPFHWHGIVLIQGKKPTTKQLVCVGCRNNAAIIENTGRQHLWVLMAVD